MVSTSDTYVNWLYGFGLGQLPQFKAFLHMQWSLRTSYSSRPAIARPVQQCVELNWRWDVYVSSSLQNFVLLLILPSTDRPLLKLSTISARLNTSAVSTYQERQELQRNLHQRWVSEAQEWSFIANLPASVSSPNKTHTTALFVFGFLSKMNTPMRWLRLHKLWRRSEVERLVSSKSFLEGDRSKSIKSWSCYQVRAFHLSACQITHCIIATRYRHLLYQSYCFVYLMSINAFLPQVSTSMSLRSVCCGTSHIPLINIPKRSLSRGRHPLFPCKSKPIFSHRLHVIGYR